MAEYSYTYKDGTELVAVARALPRCMVWSYRGTIRTVREGNTYHKARFASAEETAQLMEDYRRAGGRGAPSSWGDVFHRFFRSPRPHAGILHELRGRVSAGWQEARKSGQLAGPWWTYDIISAYAAAALKGLPKLHTGSPSKRVQRNGIYKIRFREATAPHPPNLRSGALMSWEEVERYGLTGVEVEGGVVFRHTTSVASELKMIREGFAGWKKIYRAFWGAWISNAPITCEVWEGGKPVKSWESTRPLYNPAWAQFITSSIRLRVQEHAARAAHIFVDSVMVNYDLPGQGTDIGQWKVAGYFNRPVILGAGRYGEREQGKLIYIKQSGIKRVGG